MSVPELMDCPAIDLDTDDDGGPVDVSNKLKKGADLFLQHGCLLIKNVFPQNIVDLWAADFSETYSHYFTDKNFDDALMVGRKRTMITMAIEGSFNSPDFYANHKLMPLLNYLLTPNLVLGSVGAVIALPGAELQHIHYDHYNIYDSSLGNQSAASSLSVLPPFAITVVIPLVELNEVNGTTRVWPGTHLTPDEDPVTNSGVRADPMAKLGDCYLMDYRLKHRGLPNRSGGIRPIIYNVYYRPWFRDVVNYPNQDRLNISDEELGKIPKAYKDIVCKI
jgi:hypothetical protein